MGIYCFFFRHSYEYLYDYAPGFPHLTPGEASRRGLLVFGRYRCATCNEEIDYDSAIMHGDVRALEERLSREA